MVHVPWLAQSHGRRTGAPTELIDVFPSLCDLVGIPQPTNDAYPLEGVSIKPVLRNTSLATLPGRDFALSTYPRCPRLDGPVWDDACIHVVERSAFRSVPLFFVAARSRVQCTINPTLHVDDAASFLALKSHSICRY